MKKAKPQKTTPNRKGSAVPLDGVTVQTRLDRAIRNVVLVEHALPGHQDAEDPEPLQDPIVIRALRDALIDAHDDLYWVAQAVKGSTPAPTDDEREAAGQPMTLDAVTFSITNREGDLVALAVLLR